MQCLSLATRSKFGNYISTRLFIVEIFFCYTNTISNHILDEMHLDINMFGLHIEHLACN